MSQARAIAKRSKTLRRLVGMARRSRADARTIRSLARFTRGGAFADLPHPVAVQLAYNVLLEREPDSTGEETFLSALRAGTSTAHEVIEGIRGSEEFARYKFFTDLGPSVHFGRGVFVRSLPPARRILDLGGSSRHNLAGAMVAFGYPYPFDELVIVDLPSPERHALYQDATDVAVLFPNGPVTYRYHSMVDLSAYPDDSFDLVYSGQTIEHVTPDEADVVLGAVRRVLRPGGWLALDTPNSAVCRIQQVEFIDPDHKVEYTHKEMTAKLEAAGFTITRAEGLNFSGASVASGTFDLGDTARQWGLFDDLERCYILAYVCRAPG